MEGLSEQFATTEELALYVTNVPKIVRDRLKAVPPDEHPDANLLSAFAENSLLGRERASVVDHLSRCTVCREIVVLALPAAEPVQPVLYAKRTSLISYWLTWPALRWGVVAAGVIAIASFGVVRYQRENRMEAVSLKTTATEAKNEISLPSSVSSATPEKPSTHAAYSAPQVPGAASRERRQEPAPPPEAKRTLLTNSVVGGPLLTRQPQSAARASSAAGPFFDRPQPSQSRDFRVPAANETVETVMAQNQPPRTQTSDLNEPAVAKSKNAEPLQAVSAGVAETAPSPAPSGGLTTTQLADMQLRTMQSSAQPPARWTISGAGALRRSLDQGQTWQDVNLAASDASAYKFSFAQEPVTVAAPEAAKQSSNKPALKKNAVAPPTFRAVTANGLDVWAGGSQGLLYHSTDNGNHWTRVVPTASGIALSGDVVGIDFPDPQHGKVTTSATEVWTTSDGGQTWQKQ